MSYRRLVIASMDADHEIRRISPVAVSSSDGYTTLLNGQQDHGWCFSYTCLKRLMIFAPVVAMAEVYTVHFAATNPQKMRISLEGAAEEETFMLKIYYQASQRLNIFVGERFVEDINMYEGKMKKQLVKDGKWASNNQDGTYTRQELHLSCACQLTDGTCASTALCDSSPGNVHGSNTFNRASGMLEMVIGRHSVDEYIDIHTMPTVQMSMSISVSVESFYEIKDAFISNIASLLGIDVNRIAIVDVVAGNARRRRIPVLDNQLLGVERSDRRLLEGDGASVDMEILPAAEVSIAGATVPEDIGMVNVTVTRSVNIYPGRSPPIFPRVLYAYTERVDVSVCSFPF